MKQPSFNLLLDFEATGIDPKRARIIEVGALLTDENWQPIQDWTAFVYQPEALPLTDEVRRVTNITEEMLEKSGIPIREMFEKLEANGPMMKPSYIIAYNKDYDENLYRVEYERTFGKFADTPPWLCAMRDLEPNYQHKCWKLSHLALDHGISVDPSKLHRALADVYLMRRMLEKVGHTADQMFEFQQSPWITLQAVIPKPWDDGGRGKDEAIKLGYSWETPKGSDLKFDKCWVKRVKEGQVQSEIQRAPFKVKQL